MSRQSSNTDISKTYLKHLAPNPSGNVHSKSELSPLIHDVLRDMLGEGNERGGSPSVQLGSPHLFPYSSPRYLSNSPLLPSREINGCPESKGMPLDLSFDNPEWDQCQCLYSSPLPPFHCNEVLNILDKEVENNRNNINCKREEEFKVNMKKYKKEIEREREPSERPERPERPEYNIKDIYKRILGYPVLKVVQRKTTHNNYNISENNQYLNTESIEEKMKYITSNIRPKKQNPQMKREISQFKLPERAPREISSVPCNCSKSGCRKLYCECYKRGKKCSRECRCRSCKNTKDNIYITLPHKRGNREHMGNQEHKENRGHKNIENRGNRENHENHENRENIEKNPMEIGNKYLIPPYSTRKPCNCIKCNCSKKYCECYNAGIKCSKLCKCKGCKNEHNIRKSPPDSERKDVFNKQSRERKGTAELRVSRLRGGSDVGGVVKREGEGGTMLGMGDMGVGDINNINNIRDNIKDNIKDIKDINNIKDIGKGVKVTYKGSLDMVLPQLHIVNGDCWNNTFKYHFSNTNNITGITGALHVHNHQ